MAKTDKIAAIVLAAGRGVRMKSKKVNKVMLPLVGRPMITYALDILKKSHMEKVIIVVGFAKDSVKNFLGPKYLYVEQRKRLGTAHAVRVALKKIPSSFRKILILNGDDSAFYTVEIIRELILKHAKKKAVLTLLTIETKNPGGLGRILREKNGKISQIVEEKDATAPQKKIREVNPACYLFQRSFLEKYLPQVKKSPFSQEYYLTDLVKLGIDNQERVESFQTKDIFWRGINTWEELRQAEKMMRELKNEN